MRCELYWQVNYEDDQKRSGREHPIPNATKEWRFKFLPELYGLQRVSEIYSLACHASRVNTGNSRQQIAVCTEIIIICGQLN